ncbi:hypothetical protein SLEP1_g36857 [Rubroshorea leprosula]|uniref:Uncharacterized protein n=1 Tax=Rubroshorea leprosula TaxID=152421 RepID=A0AAV5KT32_9ROSI|nr:hypothetical protein SLEP1_g36857 [Rubroshorea leprosula]
MIHLGALQVNPECRYGLKKDIWIPQLETYDGTKDPNDHLHAFYSCMQAQNASDALMCKIFLSALRGNARTWKTTSKLMRVRQRDGESLKNFMSRFNDAVLEVSSFDQAVGITGVISGLSHERFRDSLLKHPSTTFSECVLVDTGSAPDIMYFHCFESLGLDPSLLQRYDGPIYRFNNQPILVEGILTMNVAFGRGRSYVTPSVSPEPNDWTLYVDGASNSKGSGAGALLLGPDGYRSEHALKFNFDATNNMAEYEALLLGLQLALELKISAIQVYNDSQLVVNQINSICEVVDLVMVKYVTLVAELKCKFQKSVFVEVLDAPSFMKPRVMEISTDSDMPSWTDSIISFLRDGVILEDKQKAMKLRKKASRYTLVVGVLYKRSFSLPLLRCLNPYEAEYAFKDVYESVCGSHVGPFMKGVGGVTHLIVGVDYFTKWVEAQALSSLTSRKVEDFVFSSIICRYEILNQIIADNGTQVNCSSFRDFCSSYGIKLQFTSVYHLESNGMVESVNKCILEGIKPRLEQHKAKWADELNNVL